jgi:ribosomal protein L37AE/L43A
MSDEIIQEAKKLLLDELHECESCHRWATEHERNPVTWGEDPYASEISDDHTEIWECENCREESSMEV